MEVSNPKKANSPAVLTMVVRFLASSRKIASVPLDTSLLVAYLIG